MANHALSLAVCVLASLTFAPMAGAVDLVADGKPVASIVFPDEPLPVEKFAAKELQYHVQKASGAELPMMPERNAPAAGARVYVGRTKAAAEAGISAEGLPPNGFRLFGRAEKLFIVGDDTGGEPVWILHNNRNRVGSLFGVYELLETRLGCRWPWPGPLGEVIPQNATISLGDMDTSGQPALVHARWRDGGGTVAGPQGWAEPASRSQFINEQAKWLRRNRFSLGVNMDMAHAFTQWWDRHHEEHPEYFNLLPDGTRRSDPSYHGASPTLISMCVGDEGFQQAIVQHWLDTRSEARPHIDASENDTPGKCVDPQCLALDVPDPELGEAWDRRVELAKEAFEAGDANWVRHLGSLSDRYARYYLAIQEKARRVDPEAVVMGYAYANYVNPPLATKLNDGIIVGLVPPMYFPWTDEKLEYIRDQWEGWGDTGARLFLRPNWMLDGHNLPIIAARDLGEIFRFCSQRGLVGTDFDSLTGQYSTQGPNLYMIARLTARPELTPEEVLDEYYGAFGPARDAVEAYFTHFEDVCAALAEPPDGMHWSYFYRAAAAVFTPEVMSRGRELLEEAGRAAGDDELAAKRVDYLSKGLRNAELTLDAQAAYERYREGGGLGALRAAVDKLDTFRASVEDEFVANMGFLDWAEARTWNRNLLTLATEPGDKLEDPWKLAWDPEADGENRGWQDTHFDDSGWLSITTDAPWEGQPPGKKWRAEKGEDYNGVAWYRTTFSVDGEEGDTVRLIFGAVDEACTVWVNGKKLLERPYPFEGDQDSWQKAFEVEITEVVRHDGDNVVAVRVEDNEGAGGIWRPVWLIQSAPAASDEANILDNPGFEGEGGWRKSVMTGEFELAVDGTVAHTGKASGRVTCKGLGPEEAMVTHRTRSWARWYYPGLKVDPEGTYRLRAWVRTEPGFAGVLSIWVTGDAKRKTAAAESLDTDGLWREVTIEDIKPATGDLGIYLNLRQSTGTAWFDDIELVRVDG